MPSLLIILSTVLWSCSSSSLKVQSMDEQSGTLTYQNFDDLDHFKQKILEQIPCPEAYVIEGESFTPQEVGENTYRCISYADHCQSAAAEKSCYLAGVQEMKNDPNQAQEYFTSACGLGAAEACYLNASFYAGVRARSWLDKACILGHRQACEEKKLTLSEESQDMVSLGQATLERFNTLPSGLRYEVIEAGVGERPNESQTVKVFYTGRLLSGEVFDSTTKAEEPLEISLTQVIPGWREGLTQVQKGGKIRLIIPPHLAYGEQGVPGRIPPGATLIFDIELVEIL